MRLIFHGALEKLFGDSFEMAAETPAEAIEGFSRQMATWPREMRIAAVAAGNRLDSMDKLRTPSDEVHLMPAMAGGSGKFTNIILGAALIVGGILALPNPIGWSLIVSGTMLVAQGVIGLFMKAPTVKSVNDPEASKYLQVNKNTTEVGTPITMAWGEIDLAGQWLSLQSQSNNLAYGTFPTTPS